MIIDPLKRFPNQNADHRSFECVSETIADIVGNITNQPIDPGFNYGATFHLTGQQPADSGLNPIDAFNAQFIYGSLPTEDEPFDAATTSELMEANFDAYPLSDKQLAATFRQFPPKQLYSYDEVVAYQQQTKWGVGLATTFYENFLALSPDGTFPQPNGKYTYHEIEVLPGYDPRGLAVKAWLGPSWGAGGYGYLSKDVFNKIVSEIHCFDKTAWQWLSLVKAALQYGLKNPQVMKEILPLIYAQKSLK